MAEKAMLSFRLSKKCKLSFSGVSRNPSPGEKVARPSEARKSGSEVECGRKRWKRYAETDF